MCNYSGATKRKQQHEHEIIITSGEDAEATKVQKGKKRMRKVDTGKKKFFLVVL